MSMSEGWRELAAALIGPRPLLQHDLHDLVASVQCWQKGCAHLQLLPNCRQVAHKTTCSSTAAALPALPACNWWHCSQAVKELPKYESGG